LSLFDTEALWLAVRRRLAVPSFMVGLLLLPLLGALGVTGAAELGVRHFGRNWSAVFGYSARPDEDGTRALLLAAALTLAPFVQAAVALLVLPLYNAARAPRRALAVFSVGSVPLYVAGLGMVLLPGILLVLVAGFVSLVWWSQGARDLLGVPASEGIEFVTITLLASTALLGLASTAFPF
jgi:hypothetical protein